jgi:mevalonate kinase
MADLVIEGKRALERRDFVTLGGIMDHNQRLLHTLGASSKEIERLIQAALRAGAYGAKLTGAGGGGSMIALTDDADRVAAAIRHHRGRAYVVTVDRRGVQVMR